MLKLKTPLRNYARPRAFRRALTAIVMSLTGGVAVADDALSPSAAPASPFPAQAPAPLGVFGVDMLPQGKFSVFAGAGYLRLGGPQIGGSPVSSQYVIANVVSNRTPVGTHLLRLVPQSFDIYGETIGASYGFTPDITGVVAASIVEKNVNMLTFKGLVGATPLGNSVGETRGFGDTTVAGIWRVYRDPVNQINLNLGLSLPTGGTTDNQTLLLPTGASPSLRAFYGMQPGTGTFDALPGIAYSGVRDAWSWGLSYRARLPLGANAQGWRYGDYHEINAWGGYTWLPGLETTLRVNGSTQTAIHGLDAGILGFAQGANPLFYGGQHVDLFGGVNVNGRFVGLPNASIAIEGGAPLYQNLNGPQAARNWQVGVAVRYKL